MSETSTALAPRDLARLTGVSTDTLRHYERKGLLPVPPRSSGGYRRYPPETVTRVQMIQRALVIGFSLNDLARVLRERQKGGAPCRQVRSILRDRLAALERRLEELGALRTELEALLEMWDGALAATPGGQQARLLDTLGSRPALEPAKSAERGVRAMGRRT